MEKNIGFLLFTLLCFVLPLPLQAEYALPAARQIAWKTGSDIWNNGVLPNYAQVTCSPLYGDNINDDAGNIQNAINAATANTAVYLPTGSYYVNGAITLKSNVVLRGAGAATTILRLGPNGHITTSGVSKSSAYNLTGAPQKGDTQLTLQTSTQANAGDWIAIFSDDDPSLVSSTGSNGVCTWCGENGTNCIQQIVNVTAKTGSVITISKPLYYTLFTNPRFKRYTFGTQYAGVESLKLWGAVDIGSNPMICLNGCLCCWVKGVEADSSGSQNAADHCQVKWSYGCEIRDSYFHGAYANTGGVNYGIQFYFQNSDHKVENNILRHNRHSVVFEGGGSGCAVLYNYIDDNYSDDLTNLGQACYNHGAHPYMNLFEGNIISHIAADNVWGSSSHIVVFRNWLWGDETGAGVPNFPPSTGYIAIDVSDLNSYYSFVGNVLGITGQHTSWSNATLRPATQIPYPSYNTPVVYDYAASIGGSSLNHGNYDYKTNGVAYWEGGSDHALPQSLYYSSKPSFFKCLRWPCFGPDLSPVFGSLPARDRYNGIDTCPNSSTYIPKNDFCPKEDLQVFWDPSASMVNIYLRNLETPARVDIINLCGVTVASFHNIKSDRILWDKANHPGGLYFVRAESNHNMLAVRRVFLIK